MKKKKMNVKKPEAQKIEIKYEPGKMVFNVNGNEFYIDEQEANYIFGRPVQIAFESIAGRREEDFSDLNTREFIAKFQVVSSHLRHLNDTAKFLKVDPMRLRNWINSETGKKTINNYLKMPEMSRLMKKFKEELFPGDLEEEEKEEKSWPGPNSSVGKKVAVMLLEGSGPREIAEKLKVSYDKFLSWYTCKAIQQSLMRMRNEEAGKRRQEQQGE